jgi:hypothetical protein
MMRIPYGIAAGDISMTGKPFIGMLGKYRYCKFACEAVEERCRARSLIAQMQDIKAGPR